MVSELPKISDFNVVNSELPYEIWTFYMRKVNFHADVRELPNGCNWSSENIVNFYLFELNFQVFFVFCSKWTSKNNVNFCCIRSELPNFMISYAGAFWNSEFGWKWTSPIYRYELLNSGGCELPIFWTLEIFSVLPNFANVNFWVFADVNFPIFRNLENFLNLWISQMWTSKVWVVNFRVL
jgi:hypothetical protein